MISDTEAQLPFSGGFVSSTTYVQTLTGTGFSFDEDTGRYTGRVTGFSAYEVQNPNNAWTVDGLDVALNTLNSNPSSTDVSFNDLLGVPLQYKYISGDFTDVYITGLFETSPGATGVMITLRGWPATTGSLAVRVTTRCGGMKAVTS
ncbi:MAG: hypothetical protein AAGF79_07260 [Pseudomonadota bacterium]